MKYSLFDASNKFLIESIRNYEGKNLDFSILHAITATELLLKERLYIIHPTLIYEKIDVSLFNNEKTVGLNNLPQRLINFDVKISPDDCKLIKKVASWRHDIVHHMPKYKQSEANTQLSLLYDFIIKFIRQEFKKDIKKILPKNFYGTMNGLLKEWDLVIKDALYEAQVEGNILDLECPNCGVANVMSLRNNTAFCHICEISYKYGKCASCGKTQVFNSEICDDCIEDAADAYFSML